MLDHSSAAPHSNLSAVYFELGDYGQAVSHCDTGLALATDQASKHKLRLRKAKCHLFGKSFEEGLAALDEAESTAETDDLRKCLHLLRRNILPEEDVKACRAKIILEIPRYKPAMYVEL